MERTDSKRREASAPSQFCPGVRWGCRWLAGRAQVWEVGAGGCSSPAAPVT